TCSAAKQPGIRGHSVCPADHSQPVWPLCARLAAAFAALRVLSWGVLKMATPICCFMRESGIDALTRIMGFLLICMGMQFGITAVRNVGIMHV
ncbi:hypothetical protein MNN73_004067, partial [Salmonella enterica]|nr:hypothetical protein [Salmonella enterica]